jgi:hypothetical protein
MKIRFSVGLVTIIFLSGCTKILFGCQDNLLSIVPSRTYQYKAVIRECGCGAQSGKFTRVFVVPFDGPDTCDPENSLQALSLLDLSGPGEPSVQWTPGGILRVKLNGMKVKYSQGSVFDESPVTSNFAMTDDFQKLRKGSLVSIVIHK